MELLVCTAGFLEPHAVCIPQVLGRLAAGKLCSQARRAANYLYDSAALAVHAKGSGALSTLMSSGRLMQPIRTDPASRNLCWPGVPDVPVVDRRHCLKYNEARIKTATRDHKTETRRRTAEALGPLSRRTVVHGDAGCQGLHCVGTYWDLIGGEGPAL